MNISVTIDSDLFEEAMPVNDETTLIQRLEGMSVTQNEFSKPYYTSDDIHFMVIEAINYIRKLESQVEALSKKSG